MLFGIVDVFESGVSERGRRAHTRFSPGHSRSKVCVDSGIMFSCIWLLRSFESLVVSEWHGGHSKTRASTGRASRVLGADPGIYSRMRLTSPVGSPARNVEHISFDAYVGAAWSGRWSRGGRVTQRVPRCMFCMVAL